jgi:hypothetical protein
VKYVLYHEATHMSKLRLIWTLVYAAAVLIGTTRMAPANPTEPVAASAVGRWYESLPGWGCGAARLPAAYRVTSPIGPELDAFRGRDEGKSEFTVAPLRDGLAWIGAIYDPTHRIGIFHEYGTDLGKYLLIANVGAPPVAVKGKGLSALAMGGKVHLGDTLDKVRAAFSVPSTFHLTTMSGCAFPEAAAYSAAIFYGPPHHPPISAEYNLCRDFGPDIQREQILGYVVFRTNRVAVLVWDYAACAY